MSLLEGARRRGHQSAEEDRTLTEFVTANYPRLIRLAALVCDDAHEAQDAVQSGLERAWRARASLRDESRLASWLDRIVVREAIRSSRSRRSWLARLIRPTPPTELDVSDRFRPMAAAATDWADLRVAFDALSADQRAVIALHLYAGYSVAETSEIVGAPAETVRSRLRVATQRLRASMAEGAE